MKYSTMAMASALLASALVAGCGSGEAQEVLLGKRLENEGWKVVNGVVTVPNFPAPGAAQLEVTLLKQVAPSARLAGCSQFAINSTGGPDLAVLVTVTEGEVAAARAAGYLIAEGNATPFVDRFDCVARNL